MDTTGLTLAQRDMVKNLTDLAGNYSRLLMAGRQKTLRTFEAENISTALLFARAS
jgi:hypothetical protein